MSKNGKSLNFECCIYIREYGESWCDATIQGKLMWSFLGGKEILRGKKKKNLSMKILFILWFDISIYKVICPANGNVLNKKFWPSVRICFIPCCWFHVHTWVHAPIQMFSSQHSLNMTLTWSNSLFLCQLLFLEAPKPPR